MIKSNPCKNCGSTYHTKAFCDKLPRKPINRSPIKKTVKPIAKKPKAKTRSYYVKRLDSIFSTFIRLRDSVDGIATCVTCGQSAHWKEMQNGHFFTRGRYATRWDEDNCNVQDYRCNVALNGNYINYTRYMIDRHGRDFVDRLEAKSNTHEKITTLEIRNRIDYYTLVVENYKKTIA